MILFTNIKNNLSQFFRVTYILFFLERIFQPKWIILLMTKLHYTFTELKYRGWTKCI